MDFNTKAPENIFHLLRLLARDLWEGKRNIQKRIDEIEVIFSVFLSIAVAHYIGVDHVGWAAFSGYMVMRNHVVASAIRGGFRILGSISGALLAFFLVPYMQSSIFYYSILIFFISLISLYGCLLSTRSYAWFWLGVTFAMVSVASMQHGAENASYFAISRVMEVSIGTLCCIVVSLITTFFIKPHFYEVQPPGIKKSKKKGKKFKSKAFIHSLYGAIAMALIPIIWDYFKVFSLSQSCISIMCVMAIPVASIFRRRNTSKKILHRILGCASGAILAFLTLFIGDKNPYIIYPAIALGTYIGRHIENARFHIEYVGTQFTLAILVVLVPDHITAIHHGAAWDRLAGIAVGMLLLEPVRYTPQLFVWIKQLFIKSPPSDGA